MIEVMDIWTHGHGVAVLVFSMTSYENRFMWRYIEQSAPLVVALLKHQMRRLTYVRNT